MHNMLTLAYANTSMLTLTEPGHGSRQNRFGTLRLRGLGATTAGGSSLGLRVTPAPDTLREMSLDGPYIRYIHMGHMTQHICIWVVGIFLDVH